MAADCSWPVLLLLLVTTLTTNRAESPSESTPGVEENYNGSTSPMPPVEATTNRLASREDSTYSKVAKSQEQYDVIDVVASTGAMVGKPKSGQTTRIYTTGEVDEKFWLKHLGDDFRHAIHLQVGGTNEDYNRLINQTQNGVHEEVHHEYLPGAERPGSEPAPPPPQAPPSPPRQTRPFYQQSLDNRAVALKQQYLIHQQAQQPHPAQQRYNYAQQHAQNYAPQPQPHTHTHTHRYAQQPETHTQYRNTYAKPQQQQQVYKPRSYIINSSEDQYAAQSNPSPVRSAGEDRRHHEGEDDSFGGQLNFKSPFNDYGSRPTRDLTYLLYKRGL
ncbi:uncharacterized protein LOC122319759 [Drosophila ficusphila]|uniref:uncharacterized protein LOC122319759 n=1 Tax=Drosophila ficusphila TaxID=30025 RepID=UPI001C8A05AF|nr:uncharacterized protein LOC122319759 [Drosophila ficusphila]